jgi:tetratricopeptide (TPR) repeat protein
MDHLSAAGELSRAAVHAEGAGDKAMASNALDSARAQYTAALRDLDGLPSLSAPDMVRWCNVAQKLGMACVFDPISIPDREHFLERAVTLANALGDTNIRARAEYWLGYTRYAVGRARAGLPHCLQALELARASGDNRLAAQVRATLGQSLTAVARYAEAVPLLDEAIDSKKRGAAPGGGVAIGSAYALANKGLLLSDHGEFVSADDCFAQALALLGGSEHPVASSVCGLMSIALLWQGRWDEAIRVADEGARIARNSRSRQLLALCRSMAGYGRWASTGDTGPFRKQCNGSKSEVGASSLRCSTDGRSTSPPPPARRSRRGATPPGSCCARVMAIASGRPWVAARWLVWRWLLGVPTRPPVGLTVQSARPSSAGHRMRRHTTTCADPLC